MLEDLLTLLAQTTPAPRLEHSNGITVVVCGDHTVQFARGADARFFVEAHREIPALLAHVQELEAQIDQRELETVRLALTRVTAERDAARARADDLAVQLDVEARARAAAEATARAANKKLLEIVSRVRLLHTARKRK